MSKKKKKKKKKIIRLYSTSNSGHFYIYIKNKNIINKKIELKKYDPKIRKHILYREN